MTLILPTRAEARSSKVSVWRLALQPSTARLLLVVIVCAAAAVGVLATGSQTASVAAANAGADLTRLLRAMAAIKALMAGGVLAAVFWRLSSSVTAPWLGAYALASAAMAVGPGLIWNMAHVGWGAAFLHAGLLGTVVLLWRDRAVSDGLARYVAERRASIASRP